MRRVVLLFIIVIAAAVPLLPVMQSSFPDVFASLASIVPASRSSGSEAPAYRTAAVERGNLVATVRAAGTVNALGLVEVGSQISGQVRELYADFNSVVTQGELIARIDPETYEAKVAQAEAELEIAQALLPIHRAQIEREAAELENAKAAYEGSKAQTARALLGLEDAKRELHRKQALSSRAIISVADLERTQSAHQAAEIQAAAVQAQELSQAAAIRRCQAALQMAEAQLESAVAQVKQKSTVLRQAQIDLQRTYIRAPVNGTVVNRAVSRGQTVAASLQAPTLFTIAQDLTVMQVEASVVEADVSRFAVGQSVTFTVDAYPGRRFQGAVKQLRKAPQIVQNVVTYTVVIATSNPDELLLPGMTANLQVVVSTRESVLTVPNTALRFRPPLVVADEERVRGAAQSRIGDGAEDHGVSGRVFVLGPDQEPVLVPLRTGLTDGRMSEVIAGDIVEGQPVITGHASQRSQSSMSSAFLKFRLW